MRILPKRNMLVLDGESVRRGKRIQPPSRIECIISHDRGRGSHRSTETSKTVTRVLPARRVRTQNDRDLGIG